MKRVKHEKAAWVRVAYRQADSLDTKVTAAFTIHSFYTAMLYSSDPIRNGIVHYIYHALYTYCMHYRTVLVIG